MKGANFSSERDGVVGKPSRQNALRTFKFNAQTVRIRLHEQSKIKIQPRGESKDVREEDLKGFIVAVETGEENLISLSHLFEVVIRLY